MAKQAEISDGRRPVLDVAGRRRGTQAGKERSAHQLKFSWLNLVVYGHDGVAIRLGGDD